MKLDKYLALLLLSLVMLACGAEEDEKEEEVTTYATLNTSTSSGSTSHALTAVDTCIFNSSTDSFEGSFSTGENSLTRLTVTITGLVGENNTNTCTLSDSDDTDTEGCSVLFQIPNIETESAQGYDQYAMFNPGTVSDTLVYSGSCEISWGRNETTFTGTIDCGGLVRTHRQSTATNPLDNSVTGSLSDTKFSCQY